MNTYLVPICDANLNWIEPIHAHSIAEAKDKLVQILLSEWEDLNLPDDLHDMVEILSSYGIVVGELYDIEEF